VEFCDVIVINKADLVSPDDVDRLQHILHTLNPRARQVISEFGRVPLDAIMNTGLFDFEQAAQAPGWLAELRGEHVPESEQYGINSFVYRSRRPFHPQRFWNLIHTEWKGVLRSKGYFWLASRYDFAGNWAQAGGACRHGAAGLWWSAVDPAQWPDDPEYLAQIRKNLDPEFGDRRQELVFIGVGLDEAAMCAKLDACLLNDTEMRLGESAWRDLPDPFPRWGQEMEQEILEEA
jgi:G3E family GTPase